MAFTKQPLSTALSFLVMRACTHRRFTRGGSMRKSWLQTMMLLVVLAVIGSLVLGRLALRGALAAPPPSCPWSRSRRSL